MKTAGFVEKCVNFPLTQEAGCGILSKYSVGATAHLNMYAVRVFPLCIGKKPLDGPNIQRFLELRYGEIIYGKEE